MKKRTALAICALLLVLALAGPAAAFPLPDFDLTIPIIPTPTPKPIDPAFLQTVNPGALDTPIFPGLIPTATPAPAPAATPKPAPAATPKPAPAATARPDKATAKPSDRNDNKTSKGSLKGAVMTSFGLYVEDFRPRLTETWYMFTPLDLNVEGRLSYPLVAENAFIVGAVNVTVMNGAVTVDYEVVPGVSVSREFFTLVSNLDALQTLNPELLSGIRQPFGQPLDIMSAFGEDRKVVLYLNNTADFNTSAEGIVPFVPEQHKLFMQNLTGLVD